MMTSRRSFLAAALAIVFGGIAGCGGTQSTTEPAKADDPNAGLNAADQMKKMMGSPADLVKKKK